VSEFLPIALLGLFLGMRHATDPDHVIAVTTIVARQRSLGRAAAIGAIWGLGHTVTILVVGSGIILFSWVIPPRIGLSMELSVGLMLILLGIMNLTGFLQLVSDRFGSPANATVHSHAHAHGDFIHTHVHAHQPDAHPHDPDETPVNWLDRHLGSLGAYHVLRPLLVGLVHGLAGSAAVALLVLTTIHDPRWSVLYLLIFGLGTVVGMMLITAAIGLPFAYTQSHSARLNQALRMASGVLSLGFGLFIAYRIGIVNGLFTGHPTWTPE